jgi:UPF0716 protein FxsA
MALALVLLFVVLPLVELYVIVQVGHVLGILPTLGLLLLVSFVGAWLVKREGVRAWAAFRAAMVEGRVPARETADGALVILGGALLLTPGFVTDVFGALCVLPPTRALVRRALTAFAARRTGVAGWSGGPGTGRVRRVRARRMPDRRPANRPPPE